HLCSRLIIIIIIACTFLRGAGTILTNHAAATIAALHGSCFGGSSAMGAFHHGHTCISFDCVLGRASSSPRRSVYVEITIPPDALIRALFI
ncbi:hypothetical protein LJC33_02080, partial [Eubacteriales bacterium OttesenSCG-928-N13]|nr:hypothetical protein [Eubacteriales bacterium OttesenSCG-928-N13]